MQQEQLLAFAIDVLESQQIPYMVVGSLASSAHGEPRMTLDIDIVVDLRPDEVPAFCASFAADADFYLYEPAIAEAVHNGSMFNIIHTTSGNKLDFMLARRDEYGREQLSRRQRTWITPGLEGYTASPEDVILGKLWYYQEGQSEKHLRDIAGILRVSGDLLDLSYLDAWSARLGFGDVWQALREKMA